MTLRHDSKLSILVSAGSTEGPPSGITSPTSIFGSSPSTEPLLRNPIIDPTRACQPSGMPRNKVREVHVSHDDPRRHNSFVGCRHNRPGLGISEPIGGRFPRYCSRFPTLLRRQGSLGKPRPEAADVMNDYLSGLSRRAFAGELDTAASNFREVVDKA